MHNTLSEYEKRRLVNMKRNHDELVRLGLEKEEGSPKKKKKKRAKTAKTTSTVRRRSSRKKGGNSSNEMNMLQRLVDIPKKKVTKKKKKKSPTPQMFVPPVLPLKTIEIDPPKGVVRKKKASSKGWSLLDGVDPDECEMYLAGNNANGDGWSGPKPQRDARGVLYFEDFPDFRPNLTPEEILRAGSFGGGYFRSIDSKVTGVRYENVHEELPSDWLDELDLDKMVCSNEYRLKVNKYKANCGAKMVPTKKDPFGLNYWEMKHWINEQDPYGWFHWYCRFFQGRRSADDGRQVSRWCKCAGPRGRWKRNLIAKVLKKGTTYDDFTVSPVVRQTLQHWAYRLSKHDFDHDEPIVRERGASYFPRSQASLLKKK